eukprot:1050246-Pelagomonas_calceolata.AAC.2
MQTGTLPHTFPGDADRHFASHLYNHTFAGDASTLLAPCHFIVSRHSTFLGKHAHCPKMVNRQFALMMIDGELLLHPETPPMSPCIATARQIQKSDHEMYPHPNKENFGSFVPMSPDTTSPARASQHAAYGVARGREQQQHPFICNGRAGTRYGAGTWSSTTPS